MDTVLETAALVSLADYSGARELSVGRLSGDVGARSTPPVNLSVTLREEDTLRSLAARIPASPHTDDLDGGSVVRDHLGHQCPVVLSVLHTTAEAAATDPLSENDAFSLPHGPDEASLELVVSFVLGAEAGRLTLHYASDLYEAATVEQLAEHILACLDALLFDPDRPFAAAMRPSMAEADSFLEAQGPVPDAGELYMPGDLVRSWVIRTPDATAILDADGASLTYAQLGALAGGLAQRLGSTGRSDAPVAVLTSDSKTAAVAMVACQFADRCFVMLDPEVAETRTRALIAAAQCGVLLYDTSVHGRAAALAAATGLPALGYEESVDAGPIAVPATLRVADTSPAYIAFTSGTTGTPKGVVQPRSSFAQFIAWQQKQLGLGPGSRVAMWSAPVFDACYMEVFGALAYGATLCVPPSDGLRRDPEAVAAWLSAAEVTFFQGVPSFIEYVVAAFEKQPRPMAALQNVIVAGEVFPPSLARRMRAVFPAARLHNMFGPTECVLASRFEIPPDHPGHRRVPVGRPITGRRLVLLDPEGRPVPRGAVGEIGIVSCFLSSGYIGDESQTRSRFRPFGGETGEVIYHTGDFGRVGPDGTLRYLGRRDAQIKVRGIRVNLDEVEAVLYRQPQVGRCKVVDVRVAEGHVQLVAFVQPENGLAAQPDEHALAEPALASAWRRSIGEALGARVAPTRYIVVRRFPQTATGKPDLGRMRQINEELRAGSTVAVGGETAPATQGAEPAPGPSVPLRDRIRWVARQVTGRPVRDDEKLLASAGDPLLLALRLKKALLEHCPGVFDAVDVRTNASVDALHETAARTRSVSRPHTATLGERHATP
ncbi:amino acid adenylation domain-containing protein [Streptomyces sp. Tue6028]|uniref:amino acid adenylation domain-containing protein n=1 Tax=Streptomyces sp. Tue6028 TaxID=2036037 RepID=UPI003D72E6A4